MNQIVIIPARMAATRLPGKPLADIEGLPMIVRVLRQAQAAGVGPVAVAAGDREIVEAVSAAGGRAVLTDQLDTQPSEETQRLLIEIRAANPPPPQPTATPMPPSRIEPVRDPRPTKHPEARSDSRNDARPQPARGGARVGVLPLQLVGTSEAEAHLSAGLAEEITSALARFRWMFLVSSSSLARYATQTRDETAIRRAFGIDVLLDGTIQRVGSRLRVALRLLDLRVGNQVVWSRRFDREVHDLLTMQDEIAAEVVAQIDPEILLIEAQRVTQRPPLDATGYDLVLRAIPLIGRLDREPFMQAGELLRHAVAQEPDYAAAHAWFAYWLMFLVGQGWSPDPEAAMIEAGRLADRHGICHAGCRSTFGRGGRGHPSRGGISRPGGEDESRRPP